MSPGEFELLCGWMLIVGFGALAWFVFATGRAGLSDCPYSIDNPGHGKMSAGGRNERITIQQPTRDDADGDGQPTLSWATYGAFWAKVERSGGGQESESGDRQQQSEQRELFELHNCSETRGITEDMRISHRGRTLEISNVHVDWSERKSVFVTATEKPKPT